MNAYIVDTIAQEISKDALREAERYHQIKEATRPRKNQNRQRLARMTSIFSMIKIG